MLKENQQQISGVLHQAQAALNYQLRRYFPEHHLESFIEQFWLVDWQLAQGKTHTQQNLPDPNFHLVISEKGVNLVGPVSKVYSYDMAGKGRIIGVKFSVGALAGLLKQPVTAYLDREVSAQQAFGLASMNSLSALHKMHSDEQIVEALQRYFSQVDYSLSAVQVNVQTLLDTIKNESNIFKVEQLAERANLSPRTLQRYFQQYIGLSPKRLIRKYRLHQAIEALDANNTCILDVVEQLEYTDQAHLIRDFKEIVGKTPKQYLAFKA